MQIRVAVDLCEVDHPMSTSLRDPKHRVARDDPDHATVNECVSRKPVAPAGHLRLSRRGWRRVVPVLVLRHYFRLEAEISQGMTAHQIE